jgi:uncharacterized protein
MLKVFLPIANMEVDFYLLVLTGVFGGAISSMLALGSGIINTPILIIMGIPSAIAIPSQINNSLGVNFSGFINYWRQRDVDIPLGWYIFLGGVFGGFAEIYLIRYFTDLNNKIAFSKIFTVLILLILSLFTFRQSIKDFNPQPRQEKGAMMRHWMIYFPWHKIFTRSRTEMSIFVPFGVGFFVGMMTSSLGGGNNFLITPILTYLIGRTTKVVAGTSLLAGFGINIFITIFHSLNSAPVDFMLLIILVISGVIGSVIGIKISYNIPKSYLGLMGSLFMLIISAKFIYDLQLVGWQHRHRNDYFVFHFQNIIEKLNSMSFYEWTVPVVRLAYEDPFLYTLCTICFVIILAFMLQVLLNAFISKWSKD